MTVTGVQDRTSHVTIAEILVGTRPSDQDVVLDQAPDGNAALSAVATQSAESQASDPRALQDGSGVPGTGGVGAIWTAAHPLNSWVQLDWAAPRELTSVALVGSTDSQAALSEATLSFDDGSQLPIGAVLADPNRPTIVSFMPRVTRTLRLTLKGVAGSGGIALSELRAYQRGAVPVRSSGSPSSDPVRSPSASCAAPAGDPVTSDVAVRCPQTGSVVTGDSVDLQVSVAAGLLLDPRDRVDSGRHGPDRPYRACCCQPLGPGKTHHGCQRHPPWPLHRADPGQGFRPGD